MGKHRIALALSSALILGALGFVVAGCGGSSSPAAAATTATTQAGTNRTFGVAFQKYQSCLKAAGINIPAFRRPTGTNRTFTGTSRRTFTGPPPTSATRRPGGFAGLLGNLTQKQRTAVTACQKDLPNGGRGGGGFGFFGGGRRGGTTGGGAAFSKYTQCLAKHGVKFGSQSAGSSAFTKAQAACRSLLPRASTTTATTTTTNSG